MGRPLRRPTPAEIRGNVALAAAWLAVGWLALALPHNQDVALVWPPAGIALACLVRFGPGLWPAVALASTALNAALETPLWAALLMGAGNAAGSLIGAHLLRRKGLRPALDRQRDVLSFLLLGVCLAPLPAGLLGGLGVYLCREGSGSLLDPAIVWWLHDAAGILVTAPLVLTWTGPRLPWPGPGRRLEAAACAAALLLTSWFAFVPSLVSEPRHGLAFLPFPAVVWAALRFGPRGGALAAFSTVALAAWLTARDGAFVPQPDTLAMIWIFLVLICLTALLGAALVAERDTAVGERERGERQLRAVVDLVPHFVFVKDTDGVFILANRAMAEAYGTTTDRLTGARGADFLPHERILQFLEDDRRVIETGESLSRDDEVFIDATGRRRYLSTVKIPFEVPGSTAPRRAVLGCAIDVTAWREAEAALRRSERLAAIGDLAGGMAHEIRNPLFGLSAALDALLAATPSWIGEDDAEIVTSMRSQIQRLTRLIAEFQAIAAPPDSPQTRTPLWEVVEEAAAACQAVARARDVRIETTGEQVHAEALIDRARVRLALSKLLDNALRHAPAGSAVELSLGATEQELACCVRDHGPGFAPGDALRAPEPFFSRESGRFGLGLTLAQRVVADHGGRLHVDNAPSGGGRVTLYMPAAPPAPPHLRST